MICSNTPAGVLASPMVEMIAGARSSLMIVPSSQRAPAWGHRLHSSPAV